MVKRPMEPRRATRGTRWGWTGAALWMMALLVAAPATAQEPGEPVVIPTRYTEGRFYARPVTTAGDTLDLYTDTGGGLFILADVVERLDLPVEVSTTPGGDTVRTVPFSVFRADATVPEARGGPGGLPVYDPGGSLPPSVAPTDAGMLGQAWFADRVWTFDYPGRTLLLRASGDVPPHRPEHRVPLGFKTDSTGARLLSFPRIRVDIDGDTLDLLFDTGARTILTDSARAVIGGGGHRRATSFITQSVFERWRARHPDWLVVEAAEEFSGADMIRVPHIRLAGYEVGPVWFTVRPDRNFHTGMSRFMDRRVDGALGGSALKYFRVTVDYPNAVAVFERP